MSDERATEELQMKVNSHLVQCSIDHREQLNALTTGLDTLRKAVQSLAVALDRQGQRVDFLEEQQNG